MQNIVFIYFSCFINVSKLYLDVYRLCLILCICLSIPLQGLAQTITGLVQDASTSEKIEYARILISHSSKGTLSNHEGQFALANVKFPCTVVCSILGYITDTLNIESQPTSPLIIKLQAQSVFLQNVNVSEKEGDALYQLIHRLVKQIKPIKQNSKVYMSFQGHIDHHFIEMYEGYANAYCKGPDIEDIQLKAGRMGLQLYNGRHLITEDHISVLASFDFLHHVDWFPESPIPYKASNMKKHFKLAVKYRYISDNHDSIIVLQYTPRKLPKQYFCGLIWINYTQQLIEKISYNCLHTKLHPYYAIFPERHEIHDMNICITKTFRRHKQEVQLQQITTQNDLHYICYPDANQTDSMQYQVKQNGILYFYDYEQHFQSPTGVDYPFLSDVRRLNFHPYNPFFWKTYTDFNIAQTQANKEFYTDTLTLNSEHFFIHSAQNNKQGIFEHPTTIWNGQRIWFYETPHCKNPTKEHLFSWQPGVVKEIKNECQGYIYVDSNIFNNRLDVFTKTMLDPYRTVLKLPTDTLSQCILNMYFDLWEIGRRKLFEDQNLKIVINHQTYELHNQADIHQMTRQFLFETQWGQQFDAVVEWNQLIDQVLHIDNLQIFGLQHLK